jgi:cytochrome c-type biogenesis protein CcmH/NrfG
VTKDNLISAVFGILLGFIAGYLLHEVMASRQPPRFAAGTAVAPSPMAGGPAAPAAPAGPAGQAMPGGGAPEQAPPQQDPTFDQAIQQLEQFVQQNPNDAEAVRRLADLYFDQARWPQARDLYSRFLEMEPGNADVLSDLGVVYRGMKDYPKALAQFDEAQRLVPDHWQSRYNEVIVLAFDLKKYDEAEQVLAELERLQPGNPNVAQLAQEMEKQRNAA